mgnify:CR=1 FL=1
MCMYNTYYYSDLYETKEQRDKSILEQDSRNKRHLK